uniref:Uncharacterized protein n=1 Tax=Arundo donax TaxID=35708 RepID=A0A0A9AZS1_ARUDO
MRQYFYFLCIEEVKENSTPGKLINIICTYLSAAIQNLHGRCR